MTKTLPERINVFLTVSPLAIDEHFNKNDPAPIYKRQLSQEFEQYIRVAAVPARRYSIIQYKINCRSESDKQYTDPLIYAIRRHFATIKIAKQAEFERFKRRNYGLLFTGLAVIMISHIVIPLILKNENGLQSGLLSGVDIFSWVMMWQPIDKLLFHWNSYLKEINVINKLIEAEVIHTTAPEIKS
ncbi:MAG: hypothetical protein ABJA78_17705 [Ferruginibacter sp.]